MEQKHTICKRHLKLWAKYQVFNSVSKEHGGDDKETEPGEYFEDWHTPALFQFADDLADSLKRFLNFHGVTLNDIDPTEQGQGQTRERH